MHGNASGAPGDTLFVPGSHGRTVPTLSSNGLSRLSDWDLIHGALQARPAGGGGPNEPFAVLFARYASRIYSFLSRRTGDPAIAEDLTQETFLAAYRKLDRLRPERVAGGRDGTLAPWLFRVARNLAASHFRRRSSQEISGDSGATGACGHAATTEPPGGVDPQEKILHEETLDEVRRQVAALPSRYREPLLLYYAGELTQAEIAVALRIPLGTAATRLRRGLALLSRAMVPRDRRFRT